MFHVGLGLDAWFTANLRDNPNPVLMSLYAYIKTDLSQRNFNRSSRGLHKRSTIQNASLPAVRLSQTLCAEEAKSQRRKISKVWWSQLRASSEYAHHHFWSLYQSWMKQHVKWLSCQGWWHSITKRILTVYDSKKGCLVRASQVQAGLDPLEQTRGNELGLHSVKEVGLGTHAWAREMSCQC